GRHPCDAVLTHLVLGPVIAELSALGRVGQCRLECRGRVAQCRPGYTDAGRVQHLGYFAERLDAFNERFSPDFYVIIENVRLVDGTQRTFVADRCASVTISILWDDETTNFSVVFCPIVNHTSKRDGDAAGGTVTDPTFGAADDKRTIVLTGRSGR